MKQSIVHNGEYCYLCGAMATDRHHMIHGTAGRKKAEKWALTCNLCHSCHMALHDMGINDRYLQKVAQTAWEQHYNKTTEDFIKEFGKNYK